jgi:hypothetical protein
MLHPDKEEEDDDDSSVEGERSLLLKSLEQWMMAMEKIQSQPWSIQLVSRPQPKGSYLHRRQVEEREAKIHQIITHHG